MGCHFSVAIRPTNSFILAIAARCSRRRCRPGFSAAGAPVGKKNWGQIKILQHNIGI
jgi:hypothetical protein